MKKIEKLLEKDNYTAKELVGILDKSHAFILRNIRTGALQALKQGHVYIIHKNDIINFYNNLHNDNEKIISGQIQCTLSFKGKINNLYLLVKDMENLLKLQYKGSEYLEINECNIAVNKKEEVRAKVIFN